MADLRVNVAGVSFENPVIPASGAFGFGHEYEKLYPLSRLGGISVKGMTRLPKAGNPPPRIAETPMGMLNSVGLQNPGIDHFIENELPYFIREGHPYHCQCSGQHSRGLCCYGGEAGRYCR